MGGEVTGWRAVEWACRLLDADERDAVYGDLVESGVSSRRAVVEVIGLVLRRQGAAWLEWRPWVTLATIVVPIGFLLSVSSRWFADLATWRVSLYTRTGDWAYLANPGWRRDVIAAATLSIVSLFAVMAWSWTAGFAVGRLSRRAVLVTALVFCAIVLTSTVGAPSTVPVDPLATLLARVFLVCVPAWRGFIRAQRRIPLRTISTLAILLAVVAVTAIVAQGLEGSLIFGYGAVRPLPGPDHIIGTADDPRPLWWTSLVVLWPAAYLMLSARSRDRSIEDR